MLLNSFSRNPSRYGRRSSVISNQAVIVAGQSNGQYLYTHGRTQFKSVLDSVWTTTTNELLDGATSGSTLLQSNASDSNWWYDDVALTYGAAWTEFQNTVNGYSGSIRAIIWDQGENDQGDIANNTSKQTAYKAGLVIVFTAMRALIGNVPILICPIGRRGDASTGTGYQVVREIQQQLDNEYSWIHLLPEKFTEDDDGGAHLTAAGYQNYAPKAARKTLAVLGSSITGVDGPSATSASRAGNIITVTLTPDAGTDFTPTSAIEGFKFFDDISEISITSAARKDASKIDLTLAALPTTGSPRLYYGYDRLTGVDETKLVKDNSANAIPLRAAKITSLPRSETYMDDIVAGAVFQHDVRLKGYNGEQAISNLISFPNDGQAQSAYNGSLGTTTSVSTDDPGFSVSPKFWSFDGGDYTRVGGASPTAFQAGLSTNKNFTFLCHFKTPSSLSGQPNIFSCGGTGATVAGIVLRYIAASNFMRLATSNGTTATTYSMSTATQLTASTVYKMAISLNPSTRAFNVWLNSSTPVLSGTATLGGATSTSAFSVFNQFTTGTELYGYGMYDSVLSNTQVGDLFTYFSGL